MPQDTIRLLATARGMWPSLRIPLKLSNVSLKKVERLGGDVIVALG